MKTNYTFLPLLLLMLFAGACTTPATETAEEELTVEPVDIVPGPNVMPNTVVGTWHGVIPCVDCPGIVYDLSVNEDNTFEETITFQEADRAPITRRGTWQVEGDILELSGFDAATPGNRFNLAADGSLTMLDQNGKPIDTSVAANYTLQREESEMGRLPGVGGVGIDFVGTGHDPAWSLEINKQRGITFKTRPSAEVQLQAPAPEPVTQGNTTVYRATTGTGELEVRLMKEPCTDSMTQEERPYTVQVIANGKTYNGCGLYLGEGE